MTRVAALVVCFLCLVLPGPARADEVQQQLAILLQGPGPDAERAIERLRYLGAGRSGPPLRALLTHPETRVRITASAALARVLDEGSASALATALVGDEDWEVRRNCADALGALVAKRQRKALEKALGRDSNRRVRKASAFALGRLGGSGRALAASAADDPDLEVRLSALDALARSLDRSASRSLRKLLSDPSSMVRFGAARALAWSGDAAGRRFLDQALSGDEPEASRRAVLVLADVPKGWATDLLLRTTTGSTELAVEAARALARREDERGLKALVRLELQGGSTGEAARSTLDDLGIDAERRAALAGGKP